MKGYTELVKLLENIHATHGIDTDPQSICDYQDMIGHSTAEQLADLANGEYKREFYRVYDLAYGTEAVINLYRNHSDEVASLKETNRDLQFRLRDAKADVESLSAEVKVLRTQAGIAEINKMTSDKRRKELEAEIIKLKAKLYDLMTV